MLALVMLLTLTSVSAFAAEPLADDTLVASDPMGTVKFVGLFDIDENQDFESEQSPVRFGKPDRIYSKPTYLTTVAMTSLWDSDDSPYGSISCYNYGDMQTGSGAVRFIINGVIADVPAGQGANFQIDRHAAVTVSAQSLWYNGTFRIQVDAAKR